MLCLLTNYQFQYHLEMADLDMGDNSGEAKCDKGENSHELDLPLMANIHEICARHFILDLTCDMLSQSLTGSVTYFLWPVERGLGSTVKLPLSSASPEIRGNVNGIHVKTETCFECPVNNSDSTSPPCGHQSSPDGLKKSQNDILMENNTEISENVPSASFKPVKFSEDALKATYSEHADVESDQDNASANCAQSYADDGCTLTLGSQAKTHFELILDSCDIDLMAVEEIKFPHELRSEIESTKPREWKKRHGIYTQYESFARETLSFSVDKWCVKVWREGAFTAEEFPFCVRLWYRTKPCGASLKWTTDQDGSLCVFTHGHWLNNRSLFPNQDHPDSMATWQASVHVPPQFVILMSGDETATVTQDQNGFCYTYYTNMTMPSSTLSLAIGQWEHVTICEPMVTNESPLSSTTYERLLGRCPDHPDGSCYVNYCTSTELPCRLFAPKSILARAEAEIKDYIPRCMEAASNLLGPLPFCRLDILIVPKCFGSLALACPGLMYVSQTLLPGDKSGCIRLAHEISHSWFGLLIGASDWTEEWLTEGFATFLEDSIHTKAMNWAADERRDFSELRALIRHKNLAAEMETTDDQLQILRPTKGTEIKDDSSTVYVKHGMNPAKTFTLVHYLKGYFLLRYMASLVDVSRFDNFIKVFVRRYHGMNVLSQAVFATFFQMFPELSEHGFSADKLYEDWLDCPGMPKPIQTFLPSSDNVLINGVFEEFSRWKPLLKKPKRKSASKKLKMSVPDREHFPHFSPDQLVLFLELVLKEPYCPSYILTSLENTFKISTANADVRHRWCELIIKHRCVRYYPHIQHFLINEQAMGVYLFGELIITRDRRQKQLAENCFTIISPDMEEGPLTTVRGMLYGQDKD